MLFCILIWNTREKIINFSKENTWDTIKSQNKEKRQFCKVKRREELSLMKKRLMAILLGAAVAVSLTACGNGGSDKADGGSVAPEVSGATYNWQVGSVLAQDQPWGVGLDKFAELLEEYSDGRITVTVQHGGVLGSEIEMLESVQMGTLDMSIASTPSLSGFTDCMNYFDLPYLFSTHEVAWSVMDEWLEKDRCDALEGTGFKGLAFYDNGTYMVGSNVKITTPDDMKGLRIRSHSSQIQTSDLAATGANPLNVAYADIYTSLQNGTIDGISGTTLTNLYGGKFHEQTKYIAMTGHCFMPAPIVMNEDLWNSLSAEDQEIVQKAATESAKYQREYSLKVADEVMTAVLDAGIEVSDVDIAVWEKAMSSVYDEWVGKAGIEQEMIDKIKESGKQYQ